MTHSFLVVGGTQKKRQFTACRAATPDFPSGSSGLPARNVRVRSKPPNFDTTILEPAEDKQTISIDQVRDLQHQLSLKPYAAKCKTGIILEAQRLTVEAQNALLKTLEEPPAHSLLVLTAPSTKQLLPTIVSRCQIIRLPAEIDLDVESEEYKKGVEDFLALLQQGRGERLVWVEENSANLKSQISNLKLLDVWISVLRDLLLINSGCQSLTLNPTIQQFNNLTIGDLEKSIGITIKIKFLISSTNVSPRLALEVLLLDLPTLQGVTPREG